MCFHFLAIMTNAAVNVRVQVIVWTYVLISLGCISGSGMAWSYGNSLFNFLMNYQTVFQSSWITLHFHWQHVRVPIFPRSHQHLLLSIFFFITAILVGMEWYTLWSGLAFLWWLMLHIFGCADWPFVHIPLRNVCSNTLFLS